MKQPYNRTSETLPPEGSAVRVICNRLTYQGDVSYLVKEGQMGTVDHYLDLSDGAECDETVCEYVDETCVCESYDAAIKMDHDGQIVWVHADYIEPIDVTPDELAETFQSLGVNPEMRGPRN